MADDRMKRIERENAEALHFITTPIRWFLTSLKIVFMVVVLVMLVLVNQVGWLINLGDRSQRARDARQNRLETQLFNSGNTGGQWSVFDVDFRTQPDPTDKSIDRENRFWDDTRPLYAAQMEEDVNWKTKAFRTTWNMWGGNPGEGIPYCIVAMHPDRLATFYDASPGSWDTRGEDALDRKSARMQRDYEIAAMMTASLRSTLAHLKLHRSLNEVYSPLHADAQHPVAFNYCDADSAAHDPRYGIRGKLAYRSILLGISLQHAPVVRFRYVAIDPVNGDTDSQHSLNLGEIWGMCLAPNSCTEGYGRGTTYYADLFAAQAPLTDEQMLAEDAIMAMTTEEFWERAARENGITDMATVEEARKRAIFDLNGEFLDADFQI